MPKLVPGVNDLATLFPDAAAEADGWDPSTFLAGSNKNSPPAPVIDMLGLTESLNVFIGVPTSPHSNDPWIKFPHPLTYTALLKSPFDLTPVENPKEGEEYLLFYVNLKNGYNLQL